jgi:hypothetical protein
MSRAKPGMICSLITDNWFSTACHLRPNVSPGSWTLAGDMAHIGTSREVRTYVSSYQVA